MIDTNTAIHAFKEKFGNMSYEEREQYLKSMGFTFGDESHGASRRAKTEITRHRPATSRMPKGAYHKLSAGRKK